MTILRALAMGAALLWCGRAMVPNGAGPFAAVLLIAGSGPQDRDESLMGHKPFWVLADALARRGVAVLRVDKRGVGASTGDFSGATSADFAADVEAGLAEDAQGARSCAAGRLGAADHDLADRGDGLPDQLAPRRHALGRRLAGALRQGHAADPPLALQRLLRHQRGLFALGVITKESLSDNWFVWNDKQTWLLYGIPALWVPIWIDLGLRRQISIARGLLPQRWFHREPRVAAR